jgi:hypothetical protein
VASLAELTNEERIHRAQEAQRLLNEDLCKEVMQNIKRDAFEKLSRVDPENTTQIIHLQAKIAVVESFQDGLESIVLDAEGLNEKSGPL